MKRPPREPAEPRESREPRDPREPRGNRDADYDGAPVRSISPAERAVIRDVAREAATAPEDAPRIENLFRLYIEEILGWTRDSNLVARGDLGRLASRHLIESIAALPFLDHLAPKTLIDLGSGAGFPAVPIQIARPELRVTLVESRRRKGLFLGRVAQELELEHTIVKIERAEHVEPPAAGGYDVATARAVAPVAELLGWLAPLVRPGGHALLFKGSSHGEELRAWQEADQRSGAPPRWELEDVTAIEDRHLFLVPLRRLPD